MKNTNDTDFALEFLDSEERKRYSDQRIEDKQEGIRIIDKINLDDKPELIFLSKRIEFFKDNLNKKLSEKYNKRFYIELKDEFITILTNLDIENIGENISELTSKQFNLFIEREGVFGNNEKFSELNTDLGFELFDDKPILTGDKKINSLGDVENLNSVDKNTCYKKITFVKLIVRKILLLEANIQGVTVNNDIYIDVANIESGIIKDLDDIKVPLKFDLVVEIKKIASNILEEVENALNCESVPFEEESDELSNVRYTIENEVYVKLRVNNKDLNRSQVYIYDDLEIYKKLKDIYNNYSDEILNNFIQEFIDFYLENEELFIERFEKNQKLGESMTLDFNLALSQIK